MDYHKYRQDYFINPPPKQRYQFCGSFGVTLFYQEFEKSISYYTQVLGQPGYVEGSGTRGWQIGNGWLTVLKGQNGNPHNVEITLETLTVDEAEKLQQAFIDAGGRGSPPSNQLMYTPVRICPIVTPLGTEILIISQLRDCIKDDNKVPI
jgi:hypothetical protein